MPPAAQIRQIIVKMDSKGRQEIKEIADQMSGINKSVKTLSTSMGFLTNAFIGYFSLSGAKKLLDMADHMQLLSDRIAVVSGSTENASVVIAELTERANKSRVSVEELGHMYVKFGQVTRETGISTQGLLDVTETFQNSLRLSGASLAVATTEAKQFAFALASGELKGREFRAILRSNAEFGDLLSKSMGVNRVELQKLATEGQIPASKAFQALLDDVTHVNDRAAKLSTTFGQSLTIATNNIEKKIYDLNNAFGLTEKAVAVVGIAVQNLDAIFAALLVGALPKLVSMFVAVVSKLNVWLTVAALVAGAGVAIYNNWDTVRNLFADIPNKIERMVLALQLMFKLTNPFLDPVKIRASVDEFTRLTKASEQASARIGNISAVDSRRNDDKLFSDQTRKRADRAKANNIPTEEEKAQQALANLNREFLKTKDIEHYYEELDGINRLKIVQSFKAGKIELDQYNQALSELKIREIARDFQTAEISFKEFDDQTKAASLDRLIFQFREGKKSLKDLDEGVLKLSQNTSLEQFARSADKFTALRAGTRDFLESIGTIGTNVADAIKGAFSNLETAFLDFIKTGKFNFAQFTQQILDDLLRIIVRATIIRPLAAGLLSFVPTTGSAANSAGAPSQTAGNVAANGMAFDNGIRRFASGGIVNRPTLFSYNHGKTGMMGEAGTEAILPLARSGGKLGVQASVTPVTINVINQSGAEVEQTESTGPNGERTIEMLIRAKVSKGIANGEYDKVLGASFGIGRRGL